MFAPGKRRPLAACIAAAMTLASPLALATTWTVNTCDEANTGSGTTGSLRYAAAHAANMNDVIDMTGLACSTISLTTGAIAFTQYNLNVNGPGKDKLTITGKLNGNVENDRIFIHTGPGTLSFKDLSIRYGNLAPANGNAFGGCIFSSGNVNLKRVGMYSCNATASGSHNAAGGAVYTNGEFTAKQSVFAHNTADGGSAGISSGGAVYARDNVTIESSTFSFNTATAALNQGATGGAIAAKKSLTLQDSTVSNNSAFVAGAIASYTNPQTGTKVSINNSTISGNSAAQIVGGVLATAAKVYLYNSTIAFNTAFIGGKLQSPTSFIYPAAGVTVSEVFGPVAVYMHSALIANNTFGSSPAKDFDLSVLEASNTSTFNGGHSLIFAARGTVPADTITGSCPLLGPLRDNGGPTLTHALLSGSPAIDQGNNTLHFTSDQRGGSFLRLSGSLPDIGAYEVQQDDILFNTGFEGCPASF